MPSMTEPTGASTEHPDPQPDPGDRAPFGRLERPPSEPYAPPAGTASSAGGSRGAGDASGGEPGARAPGATGETTTALRALAPAIAAGIVSAAILVIVGGVLAERRGLLAIAGIGGAVLGLLAAGAAVSRDGIAPPALARGRVTRIAVVLAIATIAFAALGTWAYGRLEGGVMDPLSYLGETLGLYVPAEAAIAAIAAAWGAGAGPVRGRS